MNLLYHTTKGRIIFMFYDLRDFAQAQSYKSALLISRSTDFTLNLFDFYCCHVLISYPLKTFSKLIPRVCAIV